MKKKNMSAAEALLYLRKSREVKPNVGFLQQLGKLDDELRAQRYRRFWSSLMVGVKGLLKLVYLEIDLMNVD